MMKLSIIILTWNSKVWIELCLKSLLETLGDYTVEWIVVDNGSSDGTQQLVKAIIPQVNIIQNTNNLGVARARNQGINASEGEYILLIDDDTQAQENAITLMCEYLDQHPECGMLGPQLINPDGSTQANSLPIPSVRNKFIRILKRIVRMSSLNIYKEFIDSESPFKPGYLLGACQMIRREAFDKTGQLDERIFYGPEDADYCIRMKNEGYEVICLPSLKVIHHYQQKSYKLKKTGLLWHHFTGLCYFWRKHRSKK